MLLKWIAHVSCYINKAQPVGLGDIEVKLKLFFQCIFQPTNCVWQSMYKIICNQYICDFNYITQSLCQMCEKFKMLNIYAINQCVFFCCGCLRLLKLCLATCILFSDLLYLI